MFEAETGVVALSDVTEVIDIRLEHWVVFVIDVLNTDAIERAIFLLDVL